MKKLRLAVCGGMSWMKERILLQTPLLNTFTARPEATWPEYSGDVTENFGALLSKMKKALEKKVILIFDKFLCLT